MRYKVPILLLGLFLLSGCAFYFPYNGDEPPAGPPNEETYQADPGDYSYEMDVADFYDHLSPYGVWIALQPYGYVWQPRYVDYGWRPYSYGRWLWTDYGWTWFAQEEWGWATFHYGRWGWDDALGWFWVPGTVWAPAWVSWRWGDLYIGWAPLPPDVEFVGGVGIRTSFNFPDRYWNFVEGRYFQHDHLDRFILPYERNSGAVRHSIRRSELSLRDRQIFDDGLGADEVRRLTRSEVSRHELRDARSPKDSSVTGETVRIFRPALKANGAARPKSYVPKQDAERNIREIQSKDLERKAPAGEAEQRLRENQDRERRLLEQSQQEEKAALKRRVDEETEKASSAAERRKVAKEAEVMAGELRKAHEEEKAKVEERHQEEKKAVKGTIKKKEKKDG
jgi:hypothetical protein